MGQPSPSRSTFSALGANAPTLFQNLRLAHVFFVLLKYTLLLARVNQFILFTCYFNRPSTDGKLSMHKLSQILAARI